MLTQLLTVIILDSWRVQLGLPDPGALAEQLLLWIHGSPDPRRAHCREIRRKAGLPYLYLPCFTHLLPEPNDCTSGG